MSIGNALSLITRPAGNAHANLAELESLDYIRIIHFNTTDRLRDLIKQAREGDLLTLTLYLKQSYLFPKQYLNRYTGYKKDLLKAMG